MRKPSVGRVVHYVSYGTPGGEYTSQCRAAIVAGVPELRFDEQVIGLDDTTQLDLAVLNPTGIFFKRCVHDEETRRGGTWHWPEQVE